MALPDISGLTDAELHALIEAVRSERMKRTIASEADERITELLENAKAFGVSRQAAVTFLTNMLNKVYPSA